MSTLATPEPAEQGPSRLLIVEDDTNVRDFCVRLLRMNGYQVVAAENGRVALQYLSQASYDLVFTDLQMPEMGGIELLNELREHYPDTDAIVFTAHATVETARQALKLGAFDYLTKPVTVDDLERTVRRAMEWRRVRQEKQRLSQIVALHEMSQTFTSTLDTATAVREIVRLLWRRFAPRALSLSLLHPEDDELELLAQRGAGIDRAPNSRAAVRGYDEQAIVRAHIELVGDDHDAPSPRHLARITLRTSDRPVGLLQLARSADQPGFDNDDRTLLNVCASHIAASLDNGRLYQQLKDQNLQTIAALAAAIDARDPYTAGHSEQVRRYAVRLGEVLSLPAQRVEYIHYGALLHDIGKIGIRDYILLKPGPLSEEEYAIMQSHPTIGADILRKIKALRDVIPIIECHHERLDGRGYPRHLQGPQVREEARIVAIADAYDAMTSHRAYRRAMEAEQAFHILMNGRGTHWDGQFVEVFVEMMRREGTALLLPRPRPPQLAVNGLLERPVAIELEARD
ncbi:MAG TPA: response regulator [Kouleothrix sp.]|uniref:HD domain-containing phosphohydrolase n=1 Tax=Kouleothrix sp. TaxID=2779161 RepID=UPI002B6065A9|nr:response regulator [Kouleothrix sp.]HRC74117.1 response regulator [Kouleothrix sp.]